MDLETLNKIQEVEKETGQSVLSIYSQVPFGNVITAFREIKVSDLVDMVKSVPITKLVKGLQIITPNEISQIEVEKLKIVLKYGDMNNVAKLQEKFSERSIIIAISKTSYRRLQELLEQNNLKVMINYINRNAFLND
jgi:hypothetical protein